jgi:hypothetical protein
MKARRTTNVEKEKRKYYKEKENTILIIMFLNDLNFVPL